MFRFLGTATYGLLALTLVLEFLVLAGHMAMVITAFIAFLYLAIAWTLGQIAIVKVVHIIHRRHTYGHS